MKQTLCLTAPMKCISKVACPSLSVGCVFKCHSEVIKNIWDRVGNVCSPVNGGCLAIELVGTSSPCCKATWSLVYVVFFLIRPCVYSRTWIYRIRRGLQNSLIYQYFDIQKRATASITASVRF